MQISQSISTSYPLSATSVSTILETNHLRREYEACRKLYQVQPPEVVLFLENQAHALMDAILQKRPTVRFQLPDCTMVFPSAEAGPTLRCVPSAARMQRVGGWVNRLVHVNLATLVSQRIAELEGSPNLAAASAASLLRYCSVTYLVNDVLPAGHPVKYEAGEAEEIPSNPVGWTSGNGPALNPAGRFTGAPTLLVEEEPSESIALYGAYAQCFYLPQRVAIDEQGNLLVSNLDEAEACIASMERYFSVVSLAAGFAPYIVIDQVYQLKRYGLLGQLVNQGRALARHHMETIIHIIQQRASGQDLNRGLSLSVPYFDDQALEMKTYELEVIPVGRFEFTPAFVVRAARQEQVKVAQNFGLSPSTRKHLILNLGFLESAFFRTR